ncbi:YdcH family protein [Azoarcus sp. L1K30]|uniref:YdcH family protein n=1 Tax=Azoarcus sp. L1K30 TaxID=2820277 RepID=UPI001B821B3F|nr:YdcH family protein [Azoarcus sp. L1K30]MBR0564980.1 YdcH family protein [Azoarcus sp. L1K30]
MNDDNFEDVTSLQSRLLQLRDEHRDLDEAINKLIAAPTDDQLLIRRMKKRKLALKDRIAVIERLIEPDDLA